MKETYRDRSFTIKICAYDDDASATGDILGTLPAARVSVSPLVLLPLPPSVRTHIEVEPLNRATQRGKHTVVFNMRTAMKYRPVLLSTSQAQPGKTFSQLSDLSFARPCSRVDLTDEMNVNL